MTPGAIEAGNSLKRLLQGAAAGALVMVIVGFTWGGWTLGSTVEKVAKERAGSTIATPLPPTTVDLVPTGGIRKSAKSKSYRVHPRLYRLALAPYDGVAAQER